MSDEITMGDVAYVSSKRAAQVSGYTQDYIGQLCRAGLIQSQRVGGLWYLNLDSLYQYKKKADSYVPSAPRNIGPATESLISFDGKDYLSTAKASEVTGYTKDYVGQLARGGGILSKQVGNRWYVERSGILAHKKEKDALLGAVQAEAVGIARRGPSTSLSEGSHHEAPFYIYSREEDSLLPELPALAPRTSEASRSLTSEETGERKTIVPIHVVSGGHKTTRTHEGHGRRITSITTRTARVRGRHPLAYPALAASAVLTVVLMLSFGSPLLDKAIMAVRSQDNHAPGGFTASAAGAINSLGSLLEQLFVGELSYKRE